MALIKLANEIEKRLKALSQQTEHSKNNHRQKAVHSQLETLEDIYLSLYRLERPSKQWNLADLEKGVDLIS